MKGPTLAALGDISVLPDEILCEIFSHLRPEQVLTRIGLVCRAWHALATTNVLWMRFCQLSGVPIPSDSADYLQLYRDCVHTWSFVRDPFPCEHQEGCLFDFSSPPYAPHVLNEVVKVRDSGFIQTVLVDPVLDLTQKRAYTIALLPSHPTHTAFFDTMHIGVVFGPVNNLDGWLSHRNALVVRDGDLRGNQVYVLHLDVDRRLFVLFKREADDDETNDIGTCVLASQFPEAARDCTTAQFAVAIRNQNFSVRIVPVTAADRNRAARLHSHAAPKQ